jgi:hypothetical protein
VKLSEIETDSINYVTAVGPATCVLRCYEAAENLEQVQRMDMFVLFGSCKYAAHPTSLLMRCCCAYNFAAQDISRVQSGWKRCKIIMEWIMQNIYCKCFLPSNFLTRGAIIFEASIRAVFHVRSGQQIQKL